MRVTKRFLNIYIMAAALALLLALSCYLTARKVMAWDIELGMSKAALIQRLGEPKLHRPLERNSFLQWDNTVCSENVYFQIITVLLNESDQVLYAKITNSFFGYTFASTVESK